MPARHESGSETARCGAPHASWSALLDRTRAPGNLSARLPTRFPDETEKVSSTSRGSPSRRDVTEADGWPRRHSSASRASRPAPRASSSSSESRIAESRLGGSSIPSTCHGSGGRRTRSAVQTLPLHPVDRPHSPRCDPPRRVDAEFAPRRPRAPIGSAGCRADSGLGQQDVLGQGELAEQLDGTEADLTFLAGSQSAAATEVDSLPAPSVKEPSSRRCAPAAEALVRDRSRARRSGPRGPRG